MFEAEFRQRLSNGEVPRRSGEVATLSFEVFSRRWMETYVRANNRPSVQRSHRTVLRAHLIPWFGKYALRSITAESIEIYKAAKIREGLSSKTVNNHLALIMRCLRSAVEWRVLGRLPEYQLLTVSPPKVNFLSFEDARLLVASIPEPFWRGMVLFALRTGMRFGELIGLDWDAVDLERRTVVVQQAIVLDLLMPTKTNMVRTIPLSEEVVMVLSTWPWKEGLVFGRNQGARSLRPQTCRNRISTYSKKTGLRPVTWNLLRHSFASQLALRGSPLDVVRQLLGHTDIRTTTRYTHVGPSHLSDYVNGLDSDR